MPVRTIIGAARELYDRQDFNFRRAVGRGIPDHGELQRVSTIDVPLLIANGDSDPMILPHLSYLLTGLMPQARVKIYPEAAHGFLFQHHEEFARDVDAFLTE